MVIASMQRYSSSILLVIFLGHPVYSHLKYLKVSQCPWKRMISYQFDQIKSFEVDKFQSPAFPSSYLGGNKCSYTLQLDTFCPDWRNWSCFGEKILAVKKRFFLWRKTACFEENLATLFLSPLLLVSRPPPAHICARFYPFHLFLTIMPLQPPL